MTQYRHNELGPEVRDAIARWQEYQASTCCPSTISQRSDDVERLREHTATRSGRALADVDPRHLTAEDISAWLARRGLSANSKARYFRSVASWCGWLHRTGRISADPMVALRRPRGRVGTPDPLDLREVELVFDGAPARLVAIMVLALYAGLRAHEVAAFRGVQVRERHVVMLGKGEKPARLPLAPQLAAVAVSMPAAGWWFPSPSWSGRDHLSGNHVGALVAARFRAVGVETGSIHRLRHTYGTLVQRETRDIRVTQRLLRHASVATTMIYTAVEDGDMAAALRGLPRLTA